MKHQNTMLPPAALFGCPTNVQLVNDERFVYIYASLSFLVQ